MPAAHHHPPLASPPGQYFVPGIWTLDITATQAVLRARPSTAAGTRHTPPRQRTAGLPAHRGRDPPDPRPPLTRHRGGTRPGTSRAPPPGRSHQMASITVSIWHNVTRDDTGRHTGCHGFTPGDQMVKVFTYDTPAQGRSPAEIAEAAFAAFNDAPGSDETTELARRYRQRRLRSLSFPGKSTCCHWSCCWTSVGCCPRCCAFAPDGHAPTLPPDGTRAEGSLPVATAR